MKLKVAVICEIIALNHWASMQMHGRPASKRLDVKLTGAEQEDLK